MENDMADKHRLGFPEYTAPKAHSVSASERLRKGGLEITEKVIARDKYKTKVVIHLNQTGGCDLSTDGRVFLTPNLAIRLSDELKKWARGQGKWPLTRF